MFKQEENVLKQEINAFYGHAWRSWGDGIPMISFSMVDGRGNAADQFLTIEGAEQVIALLQTFIEQAKNLPEDDETRPVWDDTPF